MWVMIEWMPAISWCMQNACLLYEIKQEKFKHAYLKHVIIIHLEVDCIQFGYSHIMTFSCL